MSGANLTAGPPETQVGADIHGYLVEIEAKTGETHTLKIPYRRRQGSALESTDMIDIIKRLESISPSTQ